MTMNAVALEQMKSDMNQEAKRLRHKADMARESFALVRTQDLPDVSLLARTFESAAAVFESAMDKIEEKLRQDEPESSKRWNGRSTQPLDGTPGAVRV